MNTLTRAQTAALPGTGTSTEIRAQWRALLTSPRRHTLTAVHHLVYQALIGRDWRRGFTPPTNSRKLANGGFDNWGLFHALHALHHQRREVELLAPFDGLITSETLRELRRLIPYRHAWERTPARFAAGNFPFDAYETETPTGSAT